MSREFQQRIVCAACKNELGVVICGARHWDKVMHQQADAMGRKTWRAAAKVVQGFIDNQGKFLTRKEAWVVANAANQVLYRVGGDEEGELYSENLY